MPIYVTWDETHNAEKTVMRWTFDGRWTWSELIQLTIHSRNIISALAPREIDAIVVPGPNGYLLPTGNIVAEANRAMDMRTSNLRRIYMVTSPGIFAATIRTLAQTSAVNDRLFCMVSSIEEAHQLIWSASAKC